MHQDADRQTQPIRDSETPSAPAELPRSRLAEAALAVGVAPEDVEAYLRDWLRGRL